MQLKRAAEESASAQVAKANFQHDTDLANSIEMERSAAQLRAEGAQMLKEAAAKQAESAKLRSDASALDDAAAA